MGKLKTRQNIAKRYKVKKTKTGKQVIKRTDGQDHFNSRETGNTKRNKRSDKNIANTNSRKTIIRAIPYNL
jgi:ribosomal protein L35